MRLKTPVLLLIVTGLVALSSGAQPGLAASPALSASGPWLVFRAGDRISAVDADGTGLVSFDTPALLTYGELARGASPAGKWLAFRSGDLATSANATLNLLRLPDGALRPIARLLTPAIEQAAAEDRAEPAIAVSMPDALAWSPDGQYLAFVAAIDGPSSDLYVYDARRDKVTRLTDGRNEAASLTWSPDSKSIVHLEVEQFGTGAGWAVKAAWVAPAAGGRVRRLYTTNSGGEIWLGWTAPDTLGVYSFDEIAPGKARLVNTRTGRSRTLYAGTFAEAALAPDAALAFIATSYDQRLSEGVYLVSAPGRKPARIAEGSWSRVAWVEQAGRFIASGPQGILSFATDGEIARIDEMPWFAASPDGARLVVWGNSAFDARPGARIYTAGGQLVREITKDSVDVAVWRPDSRGLFYVSNGALYYSDLSSRRPRLVSRNVQAWTDGDFAWVSAR